MKNPICDEMIDSALRIHGSDAEFGCREVRIDNRLPLKDVEKTPSCASNTSARCLFPFGSDLRQISDELATIHNCIL